MKKLFALILTVAMLFSLSVTAFAAVDQDSQDPSGAMNVTYTVAPTFTVTIPATVALGEDATILAENVVVPKGKQVEVSIADANGFKATTPEGAEITYTVKNGEDAVAEGETVLAVNPGDSKRGSTTLSFVAPETIQYAGTYTGTVTFTVAVKDVPKINFTIDGTSYQADAGMTWAEWVESDYNTGEFVLGIDIDGDPMIRSSNGRVLCCPEATDAWNDLVDLSTDIESGLAYTLLGVWG